MLHTLELEDITLENGKTLERPVIAYHTFGTLNDRKDNVIWVCHALTANSDVSDWWGTIFGEGEFLDPSNYFIICANVLGSCYGSEGPLSAKKEKEALFGDFPEVTIKDMAKAHELLRNKLGIKQLFLLIGASLGGQQALEWNVSVPDLSKYAVFIATNAKHSPFGIAWNTAQRLALETDSTFGERHEDAGYNGLIAARSIAMISYRSYEGYRLTQSEETNEKISEFKAESYQRYQGEKLAKRFNAYSYYLLSKAMDSHNLGRGRSSIANALSKIESKTLVISISSDQLFPVHEQLELAKHIKNSYHVTIDSDFGHDGFLVERKKLSDCLFGLLKQQLKPLNQTVFKLKK